ncbi:MAG: glutaredoxin family protein, partial [Planctomycetaceae bacterium]|nr:glutaredoxin family protein [Planctomycetaceae bacterium]
LKDTKLTVYSAAWCPDCRRFKAWLDKEGVVYDYVGIDEDENAAAYLESHTGKRAIPFVLVNGKSWVRGYHKELPSRFDSKVFIDEALKASS